MSFLKFCFIFVIQLYEPLGVVLFVTPFFNMRKSFYTCIVNTQLVISFELHAELNVQVISHLSGIMSQLKT